MVLMDACWQNEQPRAVADVCVYHTRKKNFNNLSMLRNGVQQHVGDMGKPHSTDEV